MTVKQKVGRPSFRPPSKTVGVRISQELSDALDGYVRDLDVPKRAVIERGLRRQFAMRPDPQQGEPAPVLPRKVGPKKTVCALIDVEILDELDEYVTTYGLTKHEVFETAVSRELGIDSLPADDGGQMQLTFRAS